MIRLVAFIGVALLLAGRWTGPRAGLRSERSLGAKDIPSPSSPVLSTPVRLELMASMLDAGLPLPAALRELGAVEEHPRLSQVGERLGWGLEWEEAWKAPTPPCSGAPRSFLRVGQRSAPEETSVVELQEALHFAARTGAPAAQMLRAQSARIRRRHHREAEARAAALGVRLMLPLGLCSLPAFICLGVVPVLIGLVPTLW